MKRTAAYLRVSSDKQAREGDSIPAQRDALLTYINDRDDLILAGEYLDDGLSGTKADRDELQRLLADVEAGKIDLIIFTKLDRWFRSVRHYTATQEILDRHGVGWIAIWEPIYDTTNPAGRLIINQMMSIAQFEAENTGARIRQVQAYKVSQGEVISGTAPAGYSIVDKHLQPDDVAPNVLELFRTYDRTGSLAETARQCVGLPGLPRSQPSIKRLLRNRIYIGEHPGNDHFCPPIVPRDLFERVQAGLSRNVKKSQKNVYIFSGLIRCAECGRAYAANTRKRKRGNSLQIIPQYRCQLHYIRKPAQCPNAKVVSETALENYLITHLRELIGEVILDYEIKTAPAKDRSAQIKTLESKIRRLKELYVNDLISLDEYKADKESYLAQIEELTVETPREADPAPLRELLRTDFEEMYDDMEKPEKRRFWRAVLKEIRFGMDRSIDLYF